LAHRLGMEKVRKSKFVDLRDYTSKRKKKHNG